VSPVLESLPVLILCPHSRCNCRCLMCDIWKDTAAAEMSVSELERHLGDLEALHVEWVVLSGGEPLMHSDLFRFCALLRGRGIRTTLLSTGMLFERHAARIVESIDDAIVSLDGPPAVHDRIRRVPGAFSLLARGVGAILERRPEFPLSARSTVQRENYAHLRHTARAASHLGLRSISFLAADVASEAFNRSEPWPAGRQAKVSLSEPEIAMLEREIDALLAEWAGTGFVLESREKLLRIALHFRTCLGLSEPVAPPCNAPWVSAVVEANGTVRPCFFHRPIGRLNGNGLLSVLNGPAAVAFRSGLDVSANPVCRRCVCSLNRAALPH
jgi:MoaA/NifB/PqqE/SkfB family radical SAM enzyme